MSIEKEPGSSHTNTWGSAEGNLESRETQKAFTITIEDNDHEIVRTLHPQFVAKGGEHAVYTVDNYPDVVAKVDLHSIASIMNYNERNGHLPDYLNLETTDPTSIRAQFEHKIENDYLRIKKLRQHFDKGTVLPQKQHLMKVPVTPAILKSIFRDQPHRAPSEAWAIVTMQREAEVLKDASHTCIKAGYAERDPESLDIYNHQTDRLFVHPETPGYSAEDFEGFLVFQNSKQLNLLIEKSKKDKNLSLLLADFTHRAIIYTQNTGEILDLAGKDNIAVFQKDGTWEYKLIDALYPGDTNPVEATAKIARNLRRGNKITRHDRLVLLNTINYVRTMNALAKHFGMKETIDILDQKTKEASIDYLAETLKGLSGKSLPEQATQ